MNAKEEKVLMMIQKNGVWQLNGEGDFLIGGSYSSYFQAMFLSGSRRLGDIFCVGYTKDMHLVDPNCIFAPFCLTFMYI